MSDKHITDREFQIGDKVYLKLQPYKQTSLALRRNLKLAARYFGPYKIQNRIGQVAYKLDFPANSKIHPVFHMSLLKKKVGKKGLISIDPPEVASDGQLKIYPPLVLDQQERSLDGESALGSYFVRYVVLTAAQRVKETLSNSDENSKSAYCDSNAFKRLRSEKNYPIKKRKFLHYSSVSNSDGGISSEGISNSPEERFNGNVSGVYPKTRGVTGESPSLADQRKSFHSRDSHLKFRIKSFKVPELFIEIPESATVGSLKRTVMEAVTAVLGVGLCIGILFRGKKVRDDNKTLLQTGISRDNQIDALGFSLEPTLHKLFHCYVLEVLQ
ncbi:uncharacterized protein LOC120159959 [Hibiscus syriacus]|uniref:uncharacterized protein LOC120159959 n=1 Tax=Hibiscus syriacus TaxID=106335 RepID=UPI0019246EE9|nr:uncharacterized protein LOC120159959 [Hibiscus syriacus]